MATPPSFLRTRTPACLRRSSYSRVEGRGEACHLWGGRLDDWPRTVSAGTRCAFSPESRIAEHGRAIRVAYRALNGAARCRRRHRAFDHPVELELANVAARRLRGFL